MSRPTLLEQRIRASHHVRVHVVPVPLHAGELEILGQVARSAAWILDGLFGSDMVLGIAWGRTVSAVSEYLQRKPTRGSVIVQLNGAGNMQSTGIEYASEILGRFGEAFDARLQQFPVPAFFDYAKTRAALWGERSITSILSQQAHADIALFNVGDMTSRSAVPGGAMSSHVYVGGYLEAFVTMKAQGMVGDAATIFVRRTALTTGSR